MKVVVLCLVAIAACSSSKTDSDGDAPKRTGRDVNDPSRARGNAPLTADERACDAYYEAQLEFAARCGGLLNGSEAAIARFRILCSRELAAPGAEDLREARAACAKKLASARCDDVLRECELPPGSLKNGEACAVRAQCQSRFCKLEDGACGRCAPLVKEGGECTVPTDCDVGKGEIASCDFVGRNPTGTCSVWKLGKAGDACGETQLCDFGMHCEASSADSRTGTCAENTGKGSPCSTSASCRAGFVCIDEKCSARPEEGETCSAINECANGLACDKTCKKFTYVGTGQECDATRQCDRGRCVQAVTGGANGQPTPAGVATCIAPLEDGQSCGPNNQGFACDHFARCIGGVCVLADPARCQ
ncbi:MAG TPA: hypothetical protein VM580_29010 [Labilithrix sp.]|nr:hypothetical protein [Labilithrix sp.]